MLGFKISVTGTGWVHLNVRKISLHWLIDSQITFRYSQTHRHSLLQLRLVIVIQETLQQRKKIMNPQEFIKF